MTGEKKQKHTLGGAYPGNRRTPQQVYTPSPSEFNANGQATAHFVSYGGGNALVLKQDGIAQLQSGLPEGKQPTYIQGNVLHRRVHAYIVGRNGSLTRNVLFWY